MIGIFCPKDKRIPFLDSFFNKEITYEPERSIGELTGVAGFGTKEFISKGRKFAEKNNLPFFTVEKGISNQIFECSLRFEIEYSLLIDNTGSIYNNNGITQLGDLLNNVEVKPDLLSKASVALDYINDNTKTSEFIIIVDEIKDDNKDRERALIKILDETKTNYPLDSIKIVSPYGEQGILKGTCQNDGIEIVSNTVEVHKFIQEAKKVFVYESILGFKALLHKKEVHCSGLPFYSGWGLTIDTENNSSKTKNRTLLELFSIVFYLYEKQINPLTGMPSTLCDVLEITRGEPRHMQLNLNQRKIYCVGIQPWKRGFVRPFVKNAHNDLYFPKDVNQISNEFDEQSELLVWGHKEPSGVKELADRWNKPIMRIEDGFIRSVGLGTNVTLPWSLALDHKGIYYNPQEISELEEILNYQMFTENMILDARSIRKKIVENQLTKYNSEPIETLHLPTEGKKIILVPGQVEDDASIRYGCKDIKTNLDLLNCVREQNPDAYIIYKPHPDIVSKNRKGEVTSDFITEACNHIEVEASVISCINFADEIHTMTSLTGFDALLRGKTVFTYGSPFYSGWGLTYDRHPHARRKRQLSLDELIAGALLVYPRYFDWDNGTRVSCNTVVEKLIKKRNSGPQRNNIPNRLKKLGYLLKELYENK